MSRTLPVSSAPPSALPLSPSASSDLRHRRFRSPPSASSDLRHRRFRSPPSASSDLRHRCLRMSTLSLFRSPHSMNNQRSHCLSIVASSFPVHRPRRLRHSAFRAFMLESILFKERFGNQSPHSISVFAHDLVLLVARCRLPPRTEPLSLPTTKNRYLAVAYHQEQSPRRHSSSPITKNGALAVAYHQERSHAIQISSTKVVTGSNFRSPLPLRSASVGSNIRLQIWFKFVVLSPP
nr:hypothetical protein Iba_chr10bCG6890 [Ipomoea batatas]